MAIVSPSKEAGKLIQEIHDLVMKHTGVDFSTDVCTLNLHCGVKEEWNKMTVVYNGKVETEHGRHSQGQQINIWMLLKTDEALYNWLLEIAELVKRWAKFNPGAELYEAVINIPYEDVVMMSVNVYAQDPIEVEIPDYTDCKHRNPERPGGCDHGYVNCEQGRLCLSYEGGDRPVDKAVEKEIASPQ